MSSESVDEDNLYISNSGSNGQFLSKQSGNSGGLTWAAAGGFGSGDVILADDGSAGAPGLAFADDTDHGFFRTSDKLGYSVGGSERIRFDGKHILVGDTANSGVSIGMTLNQDTSDDKIFALKSSDVAHGHTSATETDTYWSVRKRSAAYGGVSQYVMSEDAANGSGTLNFDVRGGQADNSPGTGDNGLCNIIVGEIDGTSTGFNSFAANDTLFTVRKWESGGSGRTIFAIDEDGDIHVDGSTSITAFDEYDDAALIRAHEIDRTANSIIRTEFDKWVSYNKESLEDAGILNVMTPEKIERGDISLLNTTQLQRLHSGAIVQQRAMFETMKKVTEEMLPGFSEKLNKELEAQSLPALPV